MWCDSCGGLLTRATPRHDHQPDLSGIDDGPPLPGFRTYTKPAPKAADELREIRARAWTTRRKKYGPRGHR